MENTDLDIQSPKKLKRIDIHYVSHEIQHLFHVEKGYLYTVKELFLRPGKTVRTYIFEDRDKLVKPVVFLIFSSVIFTLILHLFHIEFTFFGTIKGRAEGINNWLNSQFGYTNLILTLFIGLWIKLFFYKRNYNLFEIVVLLCYAMGEGILIFGIFLIPDSIFPNPYLNNVSIFFYLIYSIWAIGQFFGEKKFVNYLLAIVSFLGGWAT